MRQPQYEGNFIKAEDLPLGKTFVFTVSSISEPGTVEAKGNRKVDRAVMHFEGRSKGLVMNQTHYDMMKHLYGHPHPAPPPEKPPLDETPPTPQAPPFSNWFGKSVTLQRRHLIKSMGEWNVACVRIVPATPTSLRKGLHDRLGEAMPFTDAQIAEAKSKRKRGDD